MSAVGDNHEAAYVAFLAERIAGFVPDPFLHGL
jgi:hypothetical protein